MAELSGKTLVITGASMGIGKALALGLAERGVSLVLSARSADLLEEACVACKKHGVRAEYVTGSVGKSAIATQLVEKAVALGDFFGFVHAAGVLMPGPTTWDLETEQFDTIFEASVHGAYQLVRVSYPHLLKGITKGHEARGLAVFFGSGAAEIAQPGIGAYCAAKAAEEHLMRQVAAETSKVTAFVYRPGIVETGMQLDARGCEGGAAERLRAVFQPWKEQDILLTPEESAAGLIKLLEGDISRHHGEIRDIRDENVAG